LLVPHRAPPQVADWGMLAGIPEGTGKIKYPGWTKTNKNKMKQWTKRTEIPQVAASVTLENPLSSEAGPADSREGQLLLANIPFKSSTKTFRSPPKTGNY